MHQFWIGLRPSAQCAWDTTNKLTLTNRRRLLASPPASPQASTHARPRAHARPFLNTREILHPSCASAAIATCGSSPARCRASSPARAFPDSPGMTGQGLKSKLAVRGPRRAPRAAAHPQSPPPRPVPGGAPRRVHPPPAALPTVLRPPQVGAIVLGLAAALYPIVVVPLQIAASGEKRVRPARAALRRAARAAAGPACASRPGRQMGAGLAGRDAGAPVNLCPARPCQPVPVAQRAGASPAGLQEGRCAPGRPLARLAPRWPRLTARSIQRRRPGCVRAAAPAALAQGTGPCPSPAGVRKEVERHQEAQH